MKLRRPALAATVAVLSVLGLAACEKPAPGVSVVSGMTSAYRAALCWSFDGEPLSAETCAQDVVTEALDGADVARVPVIPGQVIGISVDPVVADAGVVPRHRIAATHAAADHVDLLPLHLSRPAGGAGRRRLAPGRGRRRRHPRPLGLPAHPLTGCGVIAR